MMFEFIQIVNKAFELNQKGIACALVSLVTVEGSSYRKEGVRMLFDEHMNAVGAISGGCVEKEIISRGQKVFDTDQSLIISYDGRYRLGCEGTLYILIEKFEPSNGFMRAFETACINRLPIVLTSHFKQANDTFGNFGTIMTVNGQEYSMARNEIDQSNMIFRQRILPRFRLIIFGAEHDASKLCLQASLLGWEVIVICSEKKQINLNDFSSARELIFTNPESFDYEKVDDQTAVVLMTHNFGWDFRYLSQLRNLTVPYIGVLGSAKRNNQLQDTLLENHPDIDYDFLDSIYGPAGLNIGAVTPEEISISILSEIITLTRQKSPQSMREIGKSYSITTQSNTLKKEA